MGYVTVQQLEAKYGSIENSVKEYLNGSMQDPDECDAIRRRVSPYAIINERLSRIEHKLELLLRRDL